MDRFKKKIPGSLPQQAPTKELVVATKEVSPPGPAQSAPSPRTPISKAGLAYRIIVRPLATEKAAVIHSINKYAFVVAKNANKTQIKMAVKELYGVAPLSVNILNVEGKRVRFGQRLGRRADFKKAIVTLAPGQSIAAHEGV